MGALAIAGASTANGATVQITFNNSYISSTSGNNLIADFGNDGTAEIWGTDRHLVTDSGSLRACTVGWGVAATLGMASWSFDSNKHDTGVFLAAVVGSYESHWFATDTDSAGVHKLVSFSFSDANIRSGAQTTGYLDMIAEATYEGESRVTVSRLIFDDATGGTLGGLSVDDAAHSEYVVSAVPEASTSLGLLALGAGGLLTRRRLKRAA